MTIMIIALAALTLTVAAGVALLLWSAWRGLKEHRLALQTMRRQLKIYDALWASGGEAKGLFISPDRWSPGAAEISMTVDGLTLRRTLEPEETAMIVLRLKAIVARDTTPDGWPR